MIKRKEKFYLVLPSGSKFNIYGKHTMILGLRYGETKNRIGAQNVYVLTDSLSHHNVGIPSRSKEVSFTRETTKKGFNENERNENKKIKVLLNVLSCPVL